MRVVGSHGDTDCGSDNENREGERDDGYMSGAESDSGLVDTRQSINLVMKNLQVDNQSLKAKLKATLAGKASRSAESRGYQVIFFCNFEDTKESDNTYSPFGQGVFFLVQGCLFAMKNIVVFVFQLVSDGTYVLLANVFFAEFSFFHRKVVLAQTMRTIC